VHVGSGRRVSRFARTWLAPSCFALAWLALAWLATAPVAGCWGGPRTDPEPRLPRLVEGPLRATTRGGLYRVEVVAVPRGPRTGELFRVRTRLRDAASGELLEGALVEVDAEMPHHGHGMTTTPVHRELGGGVYLSDGMRLHMPGRWELLVRVLTPVPDEARIEIEQPPAHPAAGPPDPHPGADP
jgi:hypothetical protein